MSHVPLVRLSPGLAGLALAACASAGTHADGETTVESPTTVKREALAVGSANYIYTPPADRARTANVAAPRENVWPLVARAFDQLKLPLGTVSDPEFKLTTGLFSAQRRLGTVALSNYFDCGQGQLGIPAADTFVLAVQVTTALEAAGPNATEVRTLATATARQAMGGSNSVPCVSNGGIERAIARALQQGAAR